MRDGWLDGWMAMVCMLTCGGTAFVQLGIIVYELEDLVLVEKWWNVSRCDCLRQLVTCLASRLFCFMYTRIAAAKIGT